MSGQQVGCLLAMATAGLVGLAAIAPPQLVIALAILTLCAYFPIAWHANRR